MSLRSMKNITKISWYMIPMPYTVIYRFGILGRYKQQLLVFTDNKGKLVEDGDVERIGVDEDEDGSSLKIGNENYFDYGEDQLEVHTKQQGQTIQQPVKVELYP